MHSTPSDVNEGFKIIITRKEQKRWKSLPSFSVTKPEHIAAIPFCSMPLLSKDATQGQVKTIWQQNNIKFLIHSSNKRIDIL